MGSDGGAQAAAKSRDILLDLPSGARFSTAAHWAVTPIGQGYALAAPEGDLHLYIIDAGAAVDVEPAVAAAWESVGRAAAPARLVTAGTASNGWESAAQLDYAPDFSRRTSAQAIVFTVAGHRTIALLEGAIATLEKRGSEVALVLQSLRAPGHSPWSAAGRTAHMFDQARADALIAFTADAMKRLDIPGAGIALCNRERILFEGGIGVRSRGSADPVAADTLFQIASNTKGMTTLLLACLVDAGRLGWDDLVAEIHPRFRLATAEATARIRVRDLVSAATGLPRKDLVWATTNRVDTPPSRIFDLLAQSRPTSEFGEIYQYNNLMAAAAGFVAGHIAFPALGEGAGYDAAMQSYIFDPLGMTDTSFDFARAERVASARPHGVDWTGETVEVDPRLNLPSIASRPSGGAWSSARDMIRYVRNELREGLLPGGERMIGREALLERRRANVRMGEHASYGMGLVIDRSAGVPIIHHGGSTPGFMSDFIVAPDAGFGAVLLTNADAGMVLLPAFKQKVIELLYDAPPAASDQIDQASRRLAAEQARFAAAVSVPPEPALAARLASRYRSVDLGDIGVRANADAVVFDFGLWSSRMGSQRTATGAAELITVEPGLRGIVFTPSGDGEDSVLVVREGQHDYHYAAV